MLNVYVFRGEFSVTYPCELHHVHVYLVLITICGLFGALSSDESKSLYVYNYMLRSARGDSTPPPLSLR